MNYNKYGNKKTIVDNVTFDSKAEAIRYQELKLLLKVRKIRGLVMQPVFQLIPSFLYQGKKYQGIKYVADFQYIENGKCVIEDVKGYKTAVYELKKKLFLYFNGDKIFKETY